jgi:hypothetical protein
MIMKIKNIYLLVLVLGVLVSSCELPDNVNPKAATEVPAETLLTNAMRNGLNLIDNMSQNTNVSRMMCQYIGMTQYTDPSRYLFSDRTIQDSYWNTTYLTLNDFKEVKMLIQDLTGSESFNRMNANRLAIVDIMEVLLYHNLVDILGGVPYTDALGGFDNKTPVYDDQVAIYTDLQLRLGNAIATLTAGASDGSWGSEDLVYQGDVAMWKKFAATVKARLGMRLADVNPSTAQAELTAAINAGMLETGEAMQLPWIGSTPHNNTIYAMFAGGREDYGPANTIIDMMNALGDARLPAFFTQVDTSTEVGVVKLAYKGIEYGAVTEPYNGISHFSDATFQADYPATFSCHAEVLFILAEAAARNMNLASIGGTAQEHYEAGIQESHDFWGVTLDPTYLAHADVAWDDARNKELIGIQKWLALYNRGQEGWCVWRSFDWPVLNPPPDLSYTDIPFRMPYPYNEPNLNPDNYTAAASAIGGDNVRTRLFWDAEDGTPNPSPSF